MSGEDVKAGALALEVEYELDALAVKAARLTEAMRGLTRERDEARAEAKGLWDEIGLLNGRVASLVALSTAHGKLRKEHEAEIAHLRRGIEAYREVHECNDKETWGPSPECASCLWERDDEKRRESGDER